MPLIRPLENFYDNLNVQDELQTGGEAAEAFADDTNVTCKQNFATLNALRNILVEFGNISGLKCNLEKTVLMFIGPRDPIEADRIEALGFTIVKKIKVLGFMVTETASNLETVYDSISQKINAIITLWTKFNLTLPGRIAISKTFLVSQVTYAGAVITPTPGQLRLMQDRINNFVLRGMPCAQDRLYIPADKGGMGLINLEHIVQSLQCSWVKRVIRDGINDNWRLQWFKKCFFNILCFRPNQIDQVQNPVEYNIGNSYWTFAQKFWQTNNNFLHSPIFENNSIIRGMGDNRRVDSRMMDGAVVGMVSYERHKERWLSLTLNQLLDRGVILPYDRVLATLGFYISVNTYFNLRRCVSFALLKYGNNSKSDGTSVKMQDFLNRRGKGSKCFRLYLSNAKTCKVQGGASIGTLCTLLGIVPPADEMVRGKLLGTWNHSFWPSRIKVFLFQLYNNSLPVRARLGNRYHRDPNINIDERCRLCIGGTGAGQRETFAHIFFQCPVISSLLCMFGTRFIENHNNNRKEFTIKRLILGHDKDGDYSVIECIISSLFFYELWNVKLRGGRTSLPTIVSNMEFIFDGIIKCNKSLYDLAVLTDNTWCRIWRERVGAPHGDGARHWRG